MRTVAGEDELRHRTRKLGQRFRTVLLLVDGKRSVDEVLRLAQQAGAAVSHFDELVQLGMVEVPAAEPTHEPTTESTVPEESARPNDVPPTTPEPEAVEITTGDTPPGPPQSPIEPADRGVEAQPVSEAPAAPPRLPDPPIESESAEQTPEEQCLQQVRDLLIDTLRIDSPLFGARTFFRVRSAQSTDELIHLVWEIENHLDARTAHAR